MFGSVRRLIRPRVATKSQTTQLDFEQTILDWQWVSDSMTSEGGHSGGEEAMVRSAGLDCASGRCYECAWVLTLKGIALPWNSEELSDHKLLLRGIL